MALRGVRGENLRPESAEFRGLTLGFVSAWRKLAVRAQLRTSLVDREICWTVIAGSVACCTVTRRKSTRGTSSRGGAMTTMEQVVSQMQQELLTIRAQIAPRVQMSEAVHAADILTAAQAHEDAPNLIDVNSQGRPKVFSGKEEDFQPWAKKMEAFFAGVIKESEMMLWWAADKTMEITTDSDRSRVLADEFERGSRSAPSGVHFAAHAYDACGSHESRSKRHCCQLAEELTGGVPTTAETIWSDRRRKEEEYPSRNHLSRRCSLQELRAGIER